MERKSLVSTSNFHLRITKINRINGLFLFKYISYRKIKQLITHTIIMIFGFIIHAKLGK